jgi:SAM-dependent methyltransferase
MSTAFDCQICAAPALEVFDAFSELPRVTSDAKPWPAGGELSVCHTCGAIQKLPTDAWRQDAARIYQNYEMYHLSQGAEQLVFADAGDVKPRSQRLVEFVIGKSSLPAAGKLIDIGCGNGEALGNFSRALPEWKIYGSELTDKVLADLRRLKNFVRLYTVPPDQIEERFAFVSMIHSLEHMPSPFTAMSEATKLLDEGGTLFIEVPDVETSPFDLLVADHMMHFSRASLGHLAARSGVAVSTLVNDLAPKEITLLGRRGRTQMPPLDPAAGIDLARATVRWLCDVVAQVRGLGTGQIGIFGTSVAAMAFYGEFRERVAFFVDEDPARVGKSYDGKPVYSPAQAPAGKPVLVALPPNRAERVVERLSDRSKATFVAPVALTLGQTVH